MIAIVCLDASCGMLFGHRRQSRDRAVTERIGAICRGKKLWMHPYSYGLYQELEEADVRVDQAFLLRAQRGEYALVETERIQPHADRLEAVIVFRWNRAYPADFYLDLDLSKWKRTGEEDFPGHSHERITQTTYVRG